ncbi:MAG: bacillithiol system redox-active protein YtxJ [Thermoanaerobaculia bacterium]|nr:bacillithiol system redox-active protein YtxJ [Thermoanaerobaculia bacterium]
MATIRTLTTREDLDDLWERSRERPVWLFKHSLICGVSSRALTAYRQYADGERAAEMALIEIQPSRQLSIEVVRRTGVRHESPQAILVSGGRPVFDASHWRISAQAMARACRELTSLSGAATDA